MRSSYFIKLFFSIIVILSTERTFSQEIAFEFGDISAENMDVKKYIEKYPDAPAVVIGDIGHCRFILERDAGFQYELERKFRIIILNDRGVGLGDVSVPYYETSEGRDRIRNFRAHVYNIEDGRIRRQRVRQRAGHTADLDNNWKSLQFALPEVRPGSVIEVRYTVTSDFLHYLPTWQFQRLIPVKYTEFRLDLPTFFTYRMRYRGLDELISKSENRFSETIRVNVGTQAYGVDVQNRYVNINVFGTSYNWVAKDLPAFEPESHIRGIRNYASNMSFELLSVEFDNLPSHYYADSWESVMKYLNKRKSFGEYILSAQSLLAQNFSVNRSGCFETDVTNAYNLIKENISWNERRSLFASDKPDEVLEKGVGNSAEINLMLCVKLRNMGIDAHPVVLSTVDNVILLDAPTLSELNYVIVAAFDENGDYMLLDATEPHLPPGYLPVRVLNDRGKLLHSSRLRYIDIKNPKPAKTKKEINLSLDESGMLTGTFEIKSLYVQSYIDNKRYSKYGEEYFKYYFQRHAGVEVTNINITEGKSSGDPFVVNGELKIDGYAQIFGNEVILEPLAFEAIKESKFTDEERNYPVSLFNELEREVSITIELPENTVLIESPEPHQVTWGRNFYYEYDISYENNVIAQKITKKISQTSVSQRRYNGLVRFYNYIIDHNSKKAILEIASRD